jgi:hypothetical protein
MNGARKVLSLGAVLLAACVAHHPWLSGGARQPPPAPEHPGGPPGAVALPPEVSLIATGDIILHETVKAAAASQDAHDPSGASTNHRGLDALFSAVRDELHQSDVVFGNLETPVAPVANRGTQPFVFNAPADLPAALRTAGFNLVSVANNHAYDQGKEGLLETLADLQAAGLSSIGAGRDRDSAHQLRIVEVQGLSIGCLAYTARFNVQLNSPDPSEPEVNAAEPERMEQEVRAARARTSFVLVSIHWGSEYAAAPDPAQVALAHRLVEAGAGVILGSHPHVLQPLEIYSASDGHRALIAYSLGNFISNQSRTYAPDRDAPAVGDTRDGVLLRVSIRRQRSPSGEERGALGKVSYEPLWTDNNALERLSAPALAPRIQVVVQGREIARARDELARLDAEKTSRPEIRKRLKDRITLLEARRARVGERLGPGYAGELSARSAP